MNAMPAGFPDFPFTKYRDAVLMATRLRKPAKCVICWQPLRVGEIAWRPLAERIDNGVLRSQRFHLSHLQPRGDHNDWDLADGVTPYRLPLAKRP